MKKVLISIVFLFAITIVNSQTAHIGKVYAKAGDIVTLAVSGENLKNMGAMGFYINYDREVLTFIEITNIHAELSSVLYNNVESVVKLGWFSSNAVTPVNIESGKLFDIKFKYNGGNSIVSFDRDISIIGDIEGNNRTSDINFLNGFVFADNQTGIESLDGGGSISVYPNPTSGRVNIISGEDVKIRKVKVFNIDGREILNAVNTGSGEMSVDLSDFSSGVYFIGTDTGENIIYRKVVRGQ